MRIRVLVLVFAIVAGAEGTDLDRVIAPIQFAYRVWSGVGDSVSNHASGKRFEVVLPKDPVGPQWEQGKKHPPLGAAEAIILAVEKSKDYIKDGDDVVWGINGTTLKPWQPKQGYWYWSVEFQQRPDMVGGGGYSGPLPTFVLMVLMDGTVIQPKVR